MFVHWSNTSTNYRDMEKMEAFCNRCNNNQIHTFRLYETKTKHYSAFSIGADYSVSVICHGCLLETRIQKKDESMLIKKYQSKIACWEGFEILEKGNPGKSIKKFKKALKDDPQFPQALYGLAKCHVMMKQFHEAKMYVDELNLDYSEVQEIKELKEIISKNITS